MEKAISIANFPFLVFYLSYGFKLYLSMISEYRAVSSEVGTKVLVVLRKVDFSRYSSSLVLIEKEDINMKDFEKKQ